MKSRLVVALVASVCCTPSAVGQDFFDLEKLRTLELTFAQPDWESQLRSHKAAGLQQYVEADLMVDGVTYPSIGVRYKGNSSYWSRGTGEKPPFNLDLKAFGVDQEIYGAKEIVLNNQFTDASLMREVVSYYVLNQFTPSSRANFVKLVINGENYGVYTNVEHVGARLTSRHFGTDDGFRYKAVPPWSWPDTIDPPPNPDSIALQDLGMTLARAERAYDLKNREADPLHHQDILLTVDVLNQAAAADLVSLVDPLLDTDGAMWHLAANNVLCSLDAYFSTGQNFYLYHDTKHDRLSILPWDYNMAFGGYDNRSRPTMSPTLGTKESTRPLLARLAVGGALRQSYLSHLDTINREALDPVAIIAIVDALEALIDAEVQIDTKLGVSYSGWKNGLTNFRQFLADRHDFLLTHALLDVERPQFLQRGHSPSVPRAGQPLRFTAEVRNSQDPVQSVWARYRVRGAFSTLELFDDGLHGDGAAGDGVYANELAAGFEFGESVEYYFEARTTQSNGWSFAPLHASFRPLSFDVAWGGSTSDVVLNEFVARNNNGPTDEMGQAEDWIELYNRGAAPVDISGMYMTDDLEQPTKWEIPAGTVLAPGDSLHIWADEDLLDGPYHADFKLSTNGEQVALVDVDGSTVLDFFVFGPQEADVATARLHDGEELWVTTPDTTPFASNDLGCGARAFDALDSARNLATMSLSGTPSIGTTVTAQVAGFGAGQVFDFRVGTQAVMADDPSSGLSLLVANPIQQSRLTADANGERAIPVVIPPQASLIGVSVYAQAGIRGANPIATNAIEIVICP